MVPHEISLIPAAPNQGRYIGDVFPIPICIRRVSGAYWSEDAIMMTVTGLLFLPSHSHLASISLMTVSNDDGQLDPSLA